MYNESSTTANFDSTIMSATYNDFTGYIGNEFPAVTVNTSMFNDTTLYNVLKYFRDTGQYSKNIQDITVDDIYRTKMNNWKQWLEYNKTHKNTSTYIDMFYNIPEDSTMNILKKIDIFLNEVSALKTDNIDVLAIEKKFVVSINKFRKSISKFLDNDIVADAIYNEMNVVFKELADINSILWKKGYKTTISFSYISDLHGDIDSKVLSSVLDIFRVLEKNVKAFVDSINLLLDTEMKVAVCKDIIILRTAIKNKSSAFWTKSTDITMLWKNTLDVIG